MSIFEKRPLAFLIAGTAAGFLIFTGAGSILRVLLALFAFLLLAFSAVRFVKQKPNGRIMLIMSVFLLLSFLMSHLYFDVWFDFEKRFSENTDDAGNVEVFGVGVVTEEIYFSDGYGIYEIKTQSVNDAPLTKYRVYLTINGADTNFTPGDRISFEATVNPCDSGDQLSTYSKARGISANLSATSVPTVTGHGNPPLEYRLAVLRASFTSYCTTLLGDDAGGLLSALLVGDKELLPGNILTDFRRIGVSHVLALSGMHLAIITAALEKLLTALRINRKARSAIMIVCIIGYMAIVGFPSSVVRAGIMLIIAELLFLVGALPDRITSLFVALAVILAVKPYAIYDIALWLSFGATLGIIVAAGFAPERRGGTGTRILRFIVTSLIATFFAVALTFAIICVTFKSISLATPLTSPLFSLVAEIYMYLGGAALIFGKIIPPLVWLVRWLYSGILSCAALISGIPGIYVSCDFIVVSILCFIFTTALIIFLVCKIKRRKIYATALSLFLVMTLTVSAVLTRSVTLNSSVIYERSGSEERITLKSSGEAMVIDLSPRRKSQAYSIANILSEERIPDLDSYFLTTYSTALPDYFDTLFRQIKVRNVYLPLPENESEEDILFKISEVCLRYGTDVTLYRQGEKLTLGSIELKSLYRSALGDGAERTILSFSYSGHSVAYLSSGVLEGEITEKATDAISSSDTVIFGCHGKGYSDTIHFTGMYPGVRRIILSGNRMEIPDEILGYYESKDVSIEILPKKTVMN